MGDGDDDGDRVLPPRLKGRTRAMLEVGCSSVVLTSRPIQPVRVHVLFWGQDPSSSQAINIPAVGDPTPPHRSVSYRVVTRLKHFKTYLTDAKKLYFEVRDADGGVIGCSIMEGLKEVVDFGGVHRKLEVFGPDGTSVGELSCFLTFDSVTRAAKPKAVSFSDAVAMPRPRKMISWNLTTQRLKFLSTVDQFRVEVKNLQLKPNLEPVLRRHLGLAANRSLSYFVSHSVPHDSEPVTFCGSKRFKPKNDDAALVNFRDAASSHAVRFDPKLLDAWWTSDLQFKVFFRSLNQKTPTPLGSGSVGLKHVLMRDDGDGNARHLKIPVYASETVKRVAKGVPEIVADLNVSLEMRSSKKVPEAVAKAFPETVPEMEQEVPHEAVVPEEARTTLRSKSSCGRTMLICLLRVSEGRGFVFGSDDYCRNCSCSLPSSSSPSKTYLSCRLFSRENQATSERCEVGSGGRVKFDLQHSAPFPATPQFLDAFCKDNFLVVEVWKEKQSSSEDDRLIGVATVSLQPFLEAFKEESKLEMTRSLDLPVIAANEWLPVTDVACDDLVHGELRILLAAGFEGQIHRLATMFDRKDGDEVQEDACDSVDDDNSDNVNDDDVQDAVVKVVVKVEEGRNLPRISKDSEKRLLPSTYITLPSLRGVPTSVVIERDCHPRWDMRCVSACPSTLLTDPGRHLIVKVWHRPQPSEACENRLLGFAAVDLTPLLIKGSECVRGWYGVIDFVGRSRGQVKVEVRPEKSLGNVEALSRLRAAKHREGEEEEEEEEMISSCSSDSDDVKAFWVLPDLPSSPGRRDSRSYLADKLSDLEALSERLRARLGTEESPRNEDGDDEADPRPQMLTLDQIQCVISSQLDAMKRNFAASMSSSSSSDAEGSRMEPDGGNPSLASFK